MKDSKIEWTTHTFNPWRGCTKVSDGCENCYAEAMSGRNPAVLGEWGPTGTRVVASVAMWRQPAAWNAEAARHGRRDRVFCASLADVFEGRETMPQPSWTAVEAARVRLFHLISETPSLDWLLLTKRPENVPRLCGSPGVPRSWPEGMPPNVWLGASVENQAMADERIPHLLRADARVRFLSYEPALGPLDLGRWLPRWGGSGEFGPGDRGIDWVIVGGESGHGARDFDFDWADSLIGQCREHGVACFVKQMGQRPVADGLALRLIDRKGGDLNEWPDHLRVRQLPR